MFNAHINTSVKITAMYKYTFCSGLAVICVLFGTAIDNRSAMANEIQSPIASNFKSDRKLGTTDDSTSILSSPLRERYAIEEMAVYAQKRNEISHALDYYYESIQGSLKTQVDRL